MPSRESMLSQSQPHRSSSIREIWAQGEIPSCDSAAMITVDPTQSMPTVPQTALASAAFTLTRPMSVKGVFSMGEVEQGSW